MRPDPRPWEPVANTRCWPVLALATELSCSDQSVGAAGASAATTVSSSAESSGSGTGERLDAGASTGEGATCEKVDFLFVVDNSSSMSDEQENLVTSFAGFIATIEQVLPAQDWHIMAIDTDAGGGNGSSIQCVNGECTCTPFPGCCDSVCPGNDTCNGYPCGQVPLDACGLVLGAGKIWGEDGQSCGIAGGRRYIAAGQPDLAETFGCAAKVGTWGAGLEKPIDALITALAPAMNAPGACNDGFLREDAILVLTVITDEEDDGKSAGDPDGWYAALSLFKSQNPDSIVALGLIGDNDLDDGICAPFDGGDGAEPSPNLRSFFSKFKNGSVGSVCAPDYTPFFEQAVSVIGTACDEFIP